MLTERVHGLTDADRFDPVGRKQALRSAGLTGLDPALFDRPKQGFLLPFDRWIRQNLGATMEATMRDGAATAAVGLQGPAVQRLWDAFQGGAPGILLVEGLGAVRPDPLVPHERGPPVTDGRRYCLITPCRDEEAYGRRTLDSVLAQSRAARTLGHRRRWIHRRDARDPAPRTPRPMT